MLIDTHIHLEEIDDLERKLRTAKTYGVAGAVAMGSDYESNKKILELKKNINFFKLYVCLGIHPTSIEISELKKTITFIKDNLYEAIGIGEIGLDFWVDKQQSLRRLQKKTFLEQLLIVKDQNKPVVIHSRGAWNESLRMVKEAKIKRALFHWYSGPLDLLEEIKKEDYFISATPALEYSPKHIKAVSFMPLEKILVETDSPVSYYSKQGRYEAEPKDLIRVIKALANLKSIKESALIERMRKNTEDFFGIDITA